MLIENVRDMKRALLPHLLQIGGRGVHSLEVAANSSNTIPIYHDSPHGVPHKRAPGVGSGSQVQFPQASRYCLHAVKPIRCCPHTLFLYCCTYYHSIESSILFSPSSSNSFTPIHHSL